MDNNSELQEALSNYSITEAIELGLLPENELTSLLTDTKVAVLEMGIIDYNTRLVRIFCVFLNSYCLLGFMSGYLWRKNIRRLEKEI